MKAATILKTFPYQPPIKSSIKLTKMSFAQLLSQQFYAPKVYQMPVNNETEDYYQHDLGMKLVISSKCFNLTLILINLNHFKLHYLDLDYPFNESDSIQTST